MHRIAIGTSGLFALAAPHTVAQVEFPANHLYASSYFDASIWEVTPSGQTELLVDLYETIGLGIGVAFGADGLLYVGDGATGEIIAIDAAGTVEATIVPTNASTVEAIEFDTLGDLLVSRFSQASLHRVAHDTFETTDVFDSPTPIAHDLEIDADGRLLINQPTLAKTLFVNRDGTSTSSNELSVLSIPGTKSIWGLCVQRDRRVAIGELLSHGIICDTDVIGSTAEFVPVASLSPTIGDLDIGPNGRYYASTESGNSIVAIDRESATYDTISVPTTGNVTYLAFAPFRFDAKVKGRARNGAGEMVPISEDAVLGIQPCSRLVTLYFTDDPEDPTDFVSVTGEDRFVTFGEPSAFEAPGNKRSIHARGKRSLNSTDDITLICDWNRKFDEHGFERVVSAKGSLWFGGANSQVHLTFKTKSLRNP